MFINGVCTHIFSTDGHIVRRGTEDRTSMYLPKREEIGGRRIILGGNLCFERCCGKVPDRRVAERVSPDRSFIRLCDSLRSSTLKNAYL